MSPARSAAVVALGLLATACFSTPTPLAPNLAGSVGLPHAGVLTDAEQLPEQGDGFVRYRRGSANYWGNPRLVRGLMTAAAAVARVHPGGTPLYVGDLAARSGGRISGHHSHRTGRDVDLLFFVQTPSGAPVTSPGFVRFGGDGLAQVEEGGAFVRLDLERNWQLVKELVSSPDLGAQLLLVSHQVEALLIEHALARGEAPELIWRAETLMIEPKDSPPHDDHFHLRIACRPEEQSAGCAGGGPQWDWLWPAPEDRPLSVDELATLIAMDSTKDDSDRPAPQK